MKFIALVKHKYKLTFKLCKKFIVLPGSKTEVLILIAAQG